MDARTLPLEDRRGQLHPDLFVELAVARQIHAVARAGVRCAQPRGDALERGPRIGEDAEVQWPRDAEIARVDVDLNQPLALGMPQ